MLPKNNGTGKKSKEYRDPKIIYQDESDCEVRRLKYVIIKIIIAIFIIDIGSEI